MQYKSGGIPQDDVSAIAQDKRTPRHEGAYSVQSLLEWAFGVELARLRFGDEVEVAGLPGVGTEAVLMSRAQLGGVRIDASPVVHKPAPDAELITMIVGEELSRQMALVVADCAQAFTAPRWLPDGQRIEPKAWRRTANGWFAVKEQCGEDKVWHNGRQVIRPRYMCPVEIKPSTSEVLRRRRAYLNWWSALLVVRRRLARTEMVCHRVTVDMPVLKPWN